MDSKSSSPDATPIISPIGWRMVYLHANSGKFWKALERKWLVYFMAIWYIFDPLVYLFRFGILFHDKSGTPGKEV
jgi:hypothetical protein